MSEKYDIIVPIKDNLKKKLIFRMKSRVAIGVIMSYFGFRHEALDLLQTLSHCTRAFIWNANGLQGFVVKLDIKTLLKSDELEKVRSAIETLPES